MRRAGWLLAAVLLAGCGTAPSEKKGTVPTVSPSEKQGTVPTVTVTVAPATPTAAPAKTAKPAATVSPHRARRQQVRVAVGTAIASYVTALSDHDIGTLCAGFDAPTPEACGGPGPHRPAQPQIDAPTVLRVTLTGRPKAHRHGRRAQATVPLVVIDDAGGRTRSDERLVLRMRNGTWAVSEPSRLFYRVQNRQAP